ncbi:FAD/NAD(P)-binding domain-containing protein [Gonapodya prolifera JEL478]|uniref:FAD/NAD(P)-binding domain-containing protein n=1 Tax=Gonapodya prolifera (strain JEL478) TaxID=1344416 RepID=A0A138ZYH4_GONPJ|nr:FAD/NAD(P)-binding domain-containing protein [Gonapodya prolifera JEL478]|eukprot:KXS09163.1 FAD/NAD(P)-binding domain-containing protein [Gonapodya prolifera JEL478]
MGAWFSVSDRSAIEENVFSTEGEDQLSDDSDVESTLYDVAIVGFGPTGNLLANLLARQGHKVCVVEQSTDIYDKPRAIALDNESQRVLQMCGFSEYLQGMTEPFAGVNFVGVDGGIIFSQDTEPKPYLLAWPTSVSFSQPELERHMYNKGIKRFTAPAPSDSEKTGSVKMFLGRRVLKLVEGSDTVKLEVEDVSDDPTFVFHDIISSSKLAAAGTPPKTMTTNCTSRRARTRIEAKFVVGADGGSKQSVVRRHLKIPYKSLNFDERWVVVDAKLKRQPSHPIPQRSHQYCFPERPTTFIIGPNGHLRWEIKVMRGESPEMFLDTTHGIDRICEILRVTWPDVEALELWRASCYRFHALVACRWTSHGGRIFLAGDAAHQTPPFLGQGLNSGLRDASHLAWRLSHVLRFLPKDSAFPATSRLLKSYEEERAPHVTRAVDIARSLGKIVGQTNYFLARIRDYVMRLSAWLFPPKPLKYPTIHSGCMYQGKPLAGDLFPQPWVLDQSGSTKKMDDCLPLQDRAVFVVVGTAPEHVGDWLSEESNAFLNSIDTQRIVVLPLQLNGNGSDIKGVAHPGVVTVAEVGNVLSGWMAKAGCKVALMRPDRCYCFGGANDAESLNSLVAELKLWYS